MTSDEAGRRLRAARAISGKKQTELDDLLEKEHLSRLTGKMERGEAPFGGAYIDACVKHLGVPREWFTVEDFATWINQAEQALREAPAFDRGLTKNDLDEALEAQRLRLNAEIGELRKALRAVPRPQTDPQGEVGGSGSG